MIAAQELERSRLARELHDERAGAHSILLGLKAFDGRSDEEPSSPRPTSGSCRLGARRMSASWPELRPPALDDFGLMAALERLASSSRSGTGHLRHSTCDAARETRLPPETETALYRLVQEALTNVVKHAGAVR